MRGTCPIEDTINGNQKVRRIACFCVNCEQSDMPYDCFFQIVVNHIAVNIQLTIAIRTHTMCVFASHAYARTRRRTSSCRALNYWTVSQGWVDIHWVESGAGSFLVASNSRRGFWHIHNLHSATWQCCQLVVPVVTQLGFLTPEGNDWCWLPSMTWASNIDIDWLDTTFMLRRRVCQRCAHKSRRPYKSEIGCKFGRWTSVWEYE